MPGRRLSHDERRLLDFWKNPPGNFPSPLLRQIKINGGPGLRGIQRLMVPILYPLTVICGRNGVGKSTVLALAALSARPPASWQVYWGNARPRTRPGVRVTYTFSDFFHRRPADTPISGLRLGWISMDHGNEIEVVKERTGTRWKRVADPGRHPGSATPPIRAIDFIPVSRILPASEYGAVRSAFGRTPEPVSETLNADSLAKLSFIMGRTYEEAETRFIRGLGLPTCHAGIAYSGFDMGSGESSLIALLARLQSMPTGGLVVIEELELGLHAEAQERLVEVLLGLCSARRLQIICTTHSEVVLDHLPREARVLLRRSGDEHEAISNVSTRFAIHEMAGDARPELVVYTEDRFAAMLVEEALAGPQRARIEAKDVGSNTTLARQAVAHLRLNGPLRALSTFDGDCTDTEITRWVHDERGERQDLAPDWMTLPGDHLTPEKWVIRELERPEYLREFARQLNCTEHVAIGHVEAMRNQLDDHDSGYTLSRRAGLDQTDAHRIMIRSVASRHPGLDALRARVTALLDHQ
ncbi:MAG: ATP-dependent nuclease [Acidiferrobacteraceae bacterium]